MKIKKNKILYFYQPFLYKYISKIFKKKIKNNFYILEGDLDAGMDEFCYLLIKQRCCKNLNYIKFPCNICRNCKEIDSKKSVNILKIFPKNNIIKIKQLIYINNFFYISSINSLLKVIIIENAEKMNYKSFNYLMNLLDKFNDKILVILKTNLISKISLTLRSRGCILTFNAISKKKVINFLLKKKIFIKKIDILFWFTHNIKKIIYLSNDKWFNYAIDIIYIWFKYLYYKNIYSFIYIKVKLIYVFKDIFQYQLSLDLLLIFYRKYLKYCILKKKYKKIEILKSIIIFILNSKEKIKYNVNFQFICEQLSLYILKKNMM